MGYEPGRAAEEYGHLSRWAEAAKYYNTFVIYIACRTLQKNDIPLPRPLQKWWDRRDEEVIAKSLAKHVDDLV